MSESGESCSSDDEYESDDFLSDSESENSSEDGEEDTEDIVFQDSEEDMEDEDDQRLKELELCSSSDEETEELMKTDQVITRINDTFYRKDVRPTYINILTDFVDAEIFLIDGDSLLLELLGEQTLDWSNGGQFLHLTYLLERFLQHFTNKGGVFHIVFFKDMEIIWSSQPSMLLARQALMLHLQNNTSFTVVTSIDNYWGKQWKDYVEDKFPAFLLLTDVENIPWKINQDKQEAVKFFFRSLLCHALGQGLNCVFISGIEMTATKVVGFYTQSISIHKFFFRKVQKSVYKTWNSLATCFKHEAPLDYLECNDSVSQTDLKEKVKALLQAKPHEGCRELITALACERMLCKFLQDPNKTKETIKATEDRVKLFLLHSVLLKKLPLKYRVQEVNNLDLFYKINDTQVNFFDKFCSNLWTCLKVIQDEYPSMTTNSLDMTSVADLMDGRLVLTLFSLALEQRSMGLQAFSLPEGISKIVEDAWSKLFVAVNSDALGAQFFPIFSENEESFRPSGRSSAFDSKMKLRRLLEVKSVLVEEYAGDVRTRINDLAEIEDQEEIFHIGREFDERYHWHTRKRLTDDYDRTREDIKEKPPKNPNRRRRYYNDKQKYVRFLRFYGNSLEGGIDRAKVITVTENSDKKKKGKDKTGKVSKTQLQLIEKNKQRRKDEEMKKEQDKWCNTFKNIEPLLNKPDYENALELMNEFLKNTSFPQVRLPALMVKAKCCFRAWRQKRFGEPSTDDMKYPVLLMDVAQKIVKEEEKEGKGSLLTEKQKKKLSRYIQKLGFENIAATFHDSNAGSREQNGQFSVRQTSARFQLEHMGHLLQREERNDPDPRVEHFIPDTWQRKLLDAVDNNESAVIVAPTSSGKTYASYYCMEKVLRESNNGVVVYVSPTKALVNQVTATIYARFHRKQLPEGRAVYGVFTRDYRHDALNSQILVTVPQCLEILFLSPRRQDWTKNVKYVIFDEVHCLGEEIGAEVWEHLLLLIRCPFLALSATIGNPNHLRDWLQAAQNFREQQDKQEGDNLRESYRVNLVTCEERYSDLEKSIYLPSPSNGGFSKRTRKYEKEYDVQSTDEFVRLHPCAQLVTKQLKENGFPGDMALTPKESLQLYNTMVEKWCGKESLQKLSPEQYFLEQSFITKSNARQYERELKKELKSWADDNQMEKVEAVIQALNDTFVKRKALIDKEWMELGMPSSGKEFNIKNFPKLIEQLKAQGKLPALVFSFDRMECERMAFGLAGEFLRRERQIREQDNPKNAKLARELKQHKQAQKLLKRKRDAIEKIKEGRYHSLLEQVAVPEVRKKDYANLNRPLPQCTLAFTHGIGNEDLKKIIERIEMGKRKSKRKQIVKFKAALSRGISYHHAGLDFKRRSCVEMLFREKYLQVVTATGTLALGIHMPCKTVVLAGDSPFLNSLQYRQMSGRAGRRGFDPIGNVVFFGIPYRKVQRLITANIPWLIGNFPINVSLVLRLLLMTSKGDDEEDALTKALALLSHPFICQKHPNMESQIKKHFLFSVELLARLGLINKDTGAPQEMAGLATHLHYHEPANFVFVSFLQQGLFHKLCKRQKRGAFSEDVMRTMVLVLNHLFARRFLHANFVRTTKKCPSSKVILEDLPEDFAQGLQQYNEKVTSVFSQYLTAVAAEVENERGEENKLPLSGIEFPTQSSIKGVAEQSSGTIQNLARLSVPYSACSSFAALSGNSDLEMSSDGQEVTAAAAAIGQERNENSDGESGGSLRRKKKKKGKQKKIHDTVVGRRQPIDDLLQIIRQGVYTDMNVVPILPPKKYDSSGRVCRLNSFALDFYKHGSSEAIVKENGVKAGEVFVVLKDFCLTIKSISCSLQEWGPRNDDVVLAFQQLAQKFGEKFKKEFGKEI